MTQRYPTAEVVELLGLLYQKLPDTFTWSIYDGYATAFLDGEIIVRLSNPGTDVIIELVPNRSYGTTLVNTTWPVIQKWLYENTTILKG